MGVCLQNAVQGQGFGFRRFRSSPLIAESLEFTYGAFRHCIGFHVHREWKPPIGSLHFRWQMPSRLEGEKLSAHFAIPVVLRIANSTKHGLLKGLVWMVLPSGNVRPHGRSSCVEKCPSRGNGQPIASARGGHGRPSPAVRVAEATGVVIVPSDNGMVNLPTRYQA